MGEIQENGFIKNGFSGHTEYFLHLDFFVRPPRKEHVKKIAFCADVDAKALTPSPPELL